MAYLNAIIFGIVQGVTEFLPISSSGHLVILHEFLSLPIQDELSFDVMLHLGTLLAVVYFFRAEIIELAKAWIKSLKGEQSEMGSLSWLLVLATIPAGLAGYYFESRVESYLRSPMVVVATLAIVAALFVLAEKIGKFIYEAEDLNWKKSLFIGLAQALAIIPGTSRSGITIIAGMASGLKREAAVKFSFLLSIPIVSAASVKKIPDIISENWQANEYLILLVAFVFSYLSAFYAIKFLLNYTRRHTLNAFAVYRIILALIIFAYFFSLPA